MGDDGKPSLYRFAGIRKLISVETDEHTAEGRLHSGVEVTYSVMAVDTLDQVQRLAGGHATFRYHGAAGTTCWPMKLRLSSKS